MRGVEFLARIFDKEGIVYKTYEACAGRGSIKAVIPGANARGPATGLVVSNSDPTTLC